MVYQYIVENLKNNNIIFDDLNLKKEERIKLLQLISKFNTEKILHVVLTPPEICLKRLWERDKIKISEKMLNYFVKRFEQPTLDEGWDKIIYHEYKEVMLHGN